jgi:hypothetical protein
MHTERTEKCKRQSCHIVASWRIDFEGRAKALGNLLAQPDQALVTIQLEYRQRAKLKEMPALQLIQQIGTTAQE